ncbi:glycosyl transferase [Hahella sp. CCB-MM4]|uniref:glycosyltransferase family 2 protein n=1 Tax=Hahella sp. (strain CCB-MM4) TaxID=1926491 RepID=UPI000B9B1D92|nr:glycosyltransferase family 2 protein [Hahella sp. CCB-MM4]OZG73678.1 glycosyl transferase [Hahella sp. CCB-MM4]
MKISVITATWNSEDTIKETLDSMSAQDYENIEYIVIDGGSRDNTLKIIRDSGVKVDILVSEKDGGIYDALNKGIALATGDVIGFLHSDDVYASNSVLTKISQAFEHTGVDAVYGDLEYVSGIDESKVIRKWVSGKFNRRKIGFGWMPPHPTFYMKRKHYQKYGGFSLGYKIAADYDSILRYLWKNSLDAKYIPDVLVRMKTGGASNRSLKNILIKSKEDFQALKANGISPLFPLIWKNISKIPQFINR